MSQRQPHFRPGDSVRHGRFGLGRVLVEDGDAVVVRFAHGLEACEVASLQTVFSLQEAIRGGQWHAPLEVITRAQAEAIVSVNDGWGVFSLSRITLLPHQLWVCRRVNERWPTRWLVADDVGLGKTIEAGLILMPLLSRGLVKRLLVLCPASLVEQWQYRLRTMFDIRLARYSSEADTPASDFWSTHDQVVASLQTMRAAGNGRQDRLFEAEPWDMLIVDEAHHLNADEHSGPTLGYQLVRHLLHEERVQSAVFFTGTPHRGKDYGFLALLHLLRRDLFSLQEPARAQWVRLPEVMIRNNKQNVTDLAGSRLFQPTETHAETYTYSMAEAHFYDMLSQFILSGRAYATSLPSREWRTVTLVLIAIQKLASSSVAAVRRSLKRRLQRLEHGQTHRRQLDAILQDLDSAQRLLDEDAANVLVEQLAELADQTRLVADEAPQLRELITAAEMVGRETKIDAIVNAIAERFPQEQVLLFTEYKATQSLLISALIRRFGDGCATFINGDERVQEVVDGSGSVITLDERRENAAERFNSGKVRFLVSTEAGGEGIDLQERCHVLIHADLPWNPMRLHQRVGRLNRIGQTRPVQVLMFHNPDTVESRIWELLNTKIDSIMAALSRVMAEPEDLYQLVLGMTRPDVFTNVFADALAQRPESFDDWFHSQTASFGDQDALATVRDLVGNCARFDFQQVSARLPQADLPELRPFLLSMLSLNGRRPREDEQGLSFLTPEAWLDDQAVRRSYSGMVFDRQRRSPRGMQSVLGVGHKLVDRALREARERSACVAGLPREVLPRPLVVCRVYDRVTAGENTLRSATVGVSLSDGGDPSCALLLDWQLLMRLNEATAALGGLRRARASTAPRDADAVLKTVEAARDFVTANLVTLELPFAVPSVEVTAVLWPIDLRDDAEGQTTG